MDNLVFRIFHPPGAKKEDRHDKRRAQVRQAQRSYRERKDHYAKSLESEVAQLRANEASLLQETTTLRHVVQALKSLLADRGIDIPADLVRDGEPTSSPESSGVFKDSRLRLRAPGADASLVAYWGSTPTTNMQGLGVSSSSSSGSPPSSSDYCLVECPGDLSSLPEYQRPNGQHTQRPLPQLKGPTTAAVSCSGSTRLGDLDTTAVGMEFVLALEGPCLDHITGDPENPHLPSGHALTSSAHLLLASAPSSPVARAATPATSYRVAPVTLLDRLLALSSDLSFEGELTPVQAWHHIRHQPQFGGLEVERLRTLMEKLKSDVKCHGFGAVVDRAIFENLVFEAFVVGRLF